MTTKTIPPKYDYTNINIDTIDPDRLGMGIGVQDCALIANVYERGAHSTPTEAAVFATFSRALQNKKQFAAAAANSLTSYLQSPAESASKSLQQAGSLSSTVVPNGTSAPGTQNLQSLDLTGGKTVSFGDSFGNHLLDYAKNCIPCNLRLNAFLELHPNLDLLNSLGLHIKDSLSFINGLLDLLNNFDAFGDFCSLLNLLSFMCIPDLQRIIATLMALFLMKAPTLDGLIGLLQALIAPMFAPLLMSITALLDQFIQLVTGPLQCVLTVINTQLKSRSLEIGYYAKPGTNNDTATQVGGGLAVLNAQLTEAILAIKNKMAFYTSQVKALLGELGGGDTAYLQAKTQALMLVRLISFITAIIVALSKGHTACDTSKTPEQSELDSFMQNFLSPQTPFNVWIDPDGKVHVDEKTPMDITPLSMDGNVVQFEGAPLISQETIQAITAKLVAPIHVTVPCKLKTEVGDIDKLNQFIAELNQS